MACASLKCSMHAPQQDAISLYTGGASQLLRAQTQSALLCCLVHLRCSHAAHSLRPAEAECGQAQCCGLRHLAAVQCLTSQSLAVCRHACGYQSACHDLGAASHVHNAWQQHLPTQRYTCSKYTPQGTPEREWQAHSWLPASVAPARLLRHILWVVQDPAVNQSCDGCERATCKAAET